MFRRTCPRWSRFFYLCGFLSLLLSLGCIFIPTASPLAAQRKQYDVELDHAVEIALPSNASSILIGNSDIADLMTQSHAAIVLSGKRLGETNILIRDQNQSVILDLAVRVRSAHEDAITVFRGSTRTDYLCRSNCQEEGVRGAASSDALPSPLPPKVK